MTVRARAILPKLSHRFQWVWYRNMVVWSKFYKSSIVANIVEPLLYLIALGYGFAPLISDVNGMSYMRFIAPGLISYAAINSATFECTYSAYARMSAQKTYDAMISTPVNIDEVVAGEVLFATTKAFLSSLIMMLMITLFGLMTSWTALFIPAVMLLTGFVFSSMAMFFTSYTYSWDFFSYYLTLFIAPMYFLSGIFFPLKTLPEWVAKLAWYTPLYHSVELSRALSLGRLNLGMLEHIVWLLVVGVVVFLSAVYRIRKRIIL